MTGALTAGEPWSLRFQPHAGLKCYSVVRDGCWLSMDGLEEPVQLGPQLCAAAARTVFCHRKRSDHPEQRREGVFFFCGEIQRRRRCQPR